MIKFKPMLAKAPKLDADGNPQVTFPMFAQPKLDGIRASVVDGKLVSRTLKPIPNASIREAMERPEFEGLDGELIVGDPTADDCYRRTASFVMSDDKTDEPWAYYAFDKWDDAGSFGVRYDAARGVVKRFDWTDIPIFTVPMMEVIDLPTLEAYEAKTVAAGHEGVILRSPNAPYKFGRSGVTGPLIKLKRFIDFEARVVGVYEEMHNANEAKRNALGRTERSSHQANKIGKGTLGGLVLVALNGPAEGVEFRCGTGFDAAMRRDLWVEAKEGYPDSPFPTLHAAGFLRGRIAKVKSFPIGVKDKPRHPVFLGWRHAEDM